jgi:hypothetical protein
LGAYLGARLLDTELVECVLANSCQDDELDVELVDVDINGALDVELVDVDINGALDVELVDVDINGTLDVELVDVDINGTLDVELVDVDINGTLDVELVDTNGVLDVGPEVGIDELDVEVVDDTAGTLLGSVAPLPPKPVDFELNIPAEPEPTTIRIVVRS